MNFVLNLILVLQIVSALGMIGLILMQHGKGADMGAAFGGGASGSLFGATGSANFLSRATAALAVVFFVSTLALAYFGFSIQIREPSSGSVLERAAVSAPAVPTPAAEIPAAVPGEAVGAIPAEGAATVPAPEATGAAQIPGQ